MNLYTCGYEGFSAPDFVARLTEQGVKLVVDVRELPLSRKKGFSKTSLAALLMAVGIGYRHVPALGCPKYIRNRYKADSNWAAYTRAFTTYLSTQSAAVSDLATTARKKTTCLVCFEADYNYCHRTYVGRAATRAGAPPLIHIGLKTTTPDVCFRRAA